MSESIFKDADTPVELLGLLTGAASVCWEHPSGAGEFDSSRASELVDLALARLVELGWATSQPTEEDRLRDGVAAVIRERYTGDFNPILPKLQALLDDTEKRES